MFCFPNPTNGRTTFLYETLNKGSKVSFHVYNHANDEVYVKILDSLKGRFVLDTEELPKGKYLCVLRVDEAIVCDSVLRVK